jgi:hypothetical protein
VPKVNRKPASSKRRLSILECTLVISDDAIYNEEEERGAFTKD